MSNEIFLIKQRNRRLFLTENGTWTKTPENAKFYMTKKRALFVKANVNEDVVIVETEFKIKIKYHQRKRA